MAKRQRFTKEFKLEALRLWKSSGRPAAAVARELGLRRNHLYKWQHEVETFGEASFPGKGGRAHSTDELSRLRRENARLREERDILKKAAAFFARGSNRISSPRRPRTACSRSSWRPRRIGSGLVISRPLPPARAGCTWPCSSICTRGGSSAGR